MNKEIKYRLIKHITFLENELNDYEIFKALSWDEYNKDRSRRRDVERWIENIVNSSIDISKIILFSEKKTLPDTYKDIIAFLALLPDFNEDNVKKLAECVKLRNIISHEYLDIKWLPIKRFISESKPLYEDFLKQVKDYLEKKLREGD